MDLQAILDASSSSSDDDNDYLTRYTNTNYNSSNNNDNNNAIDIALSSTTISSNLSNPSKDNHNNQLLQNHHPHHHPMNNNNNNVEEYNNNNQEEVLSGISFNIDTQENDDIMLHGAADLILRDLQQQQQQVTTTKSSPYRLSSSTTTSYNTTTKGGTANLELERILREADINDDDEEDIALPASSRNSSSMSMTTNMQKRSSSDYLLQSILNEADDDDSDNSDDYNNHSFTAKQSSYNTNTAHSSSSLANANNNNIPLSHSWEVDAILNSIQDDDSYDDDMNDYELKNNNNVRNYSYSSSQRQKQQQHDDDSDSSSEDDRRIGNGGRRLLLSNNYYYQENVKYDDNISMQYPLSSRKGENLEKKKKIEQHSSSEQKDNHVYMHHDVGQRQQLDDDDDDTLLKDYTANFLSDIGSRRSGEEMEEYNNVDARNNDNTTSHHKRTSSSSSRIVDQVDDHLSTLCLQHAETTVRKLLKPNTRNIISPLTVKRRMKPKVELMTKSRSQQQKSKSKQQSSNSSHQQQYQKQQQQQQQQQQPRFGFSGGIIQSKSMSTLGKQFLKRNNNNNTTKSTTGLPTALAVNSKFIAVGNQRGEIYVFDLFEQLKIILGKEDEDDTTGTEITTTTTTGSVTSIDLSFNGDFLLAGYTSGQIILWDVIKGSILKHVVELHTSSISSARFTTTGRMPSNQNSISSSGDNEIGAVSVDASGLVNKLVFTKGRLWSSSYSIESECLLDGTAGQILAMDALSPLDVTQNTTVDHHHHTGCGGGVGLLHPSVHKIVLIALSSARSSFAVSVEPKVSVLHRWARPSTERIDPTIGEEDRLTQVSSSSSVYAASSYASSYMSTSTYQSNSTTVEPPKSSTKVDTTPVPYLPCLSWGWALVSGGGHSVTPILARAWGCCLQFLRASFPEMDEYDDLNDTAVAEGSNNMVHWPAFGTHDEFDASAPVVALNWLGKRSLVYLTITNEFIIIDTVIMTMQERLDFSGMELIYAEFALSRSHQRHPNNGCTTTFMNSIRSNDNRLLVLCQGEVKEITVLGMRQQIVSLEDGGQWLEALALALDHYESTITSQEDNRREDYDALSSLKRLDVMTGSSDPSSLLTEDEIWMAELLMRYLILAIDNAPDSSPMEYSFSISGGSSSSKLPNRLNLAESHFEMLSGVCIEFCIVTRRLDLLFGPIFRCFYEARYINVFLDVMETYILNDRLKYVAPEAMVLFVSHCKDMKDLSMVERCLLHMDCKLMDFDSILSLLKRNSLYTGLIHVYSSGLDDYISPGEILFDALFESADSSEEDMIVDRRKDGIPNNKFEQYGYKILLYLQYCFRGKSYPKGNDILPEERIQTLRPELFDLLFRETCSSPRRSPSSSQPQSRNNSFRGIRALSYPYLRALILIDVKAFLDCLALAFDDPGARFAQSASQMRTLGSYEVEYETDDMLMTEHVSPEEDEADNKLLPDRQYLINILSSIIMSDSLVDDSSYHFGSRKQMTLLSIKAKHFYLDFLAKYLRLGVITAPKSLTGEVFIRLCNKKGASEDGVLSLLQALPRTAYELDEVLYTIERVQMTRGALILHKVGVTNSIDREGMSEKCQHHFNRSIDCYLSDKDDDFRKGVFGYVRKECSSSGNSSMLRNVVLQRLPELVILDAVHSAHLVGEIFVEEIDMILSSLQGIDSGRVEFSFLHAIISGDLSKVDLVIAQELSANLTVDHHHTYLLLMTKFEPDIVYQYLSSNQNYRLNDALKLCQDRNITDASAYLLERMGDVSGALKLMLETLDTYLITLKNILQHSSQSRRNSHRFDPKSNVHQNETAEKEIVRIRQILSAVLDLCERNKNDHLTLDNERDGPLLWFHVLDRLVNAKTLLRIPNDSTQRISVELSSVLSEMLLMTMQRMISNVSLFELMHKITNDHAGSDLGEFREMLVSMLKTYSSELDVCSSAVDVMYYDIQRMSYEKKNLKVRGSFVQDCPKDIPKLSFLDVGPSGNYKIKSPRSVYGSNSHFFSSTNEQTTCNAHLSLLQQRRRGNRCQTRRTSDKRLGCNMKTSSECQYSSSRVDVAFRQVGGLSEAQNVGGL